MMISEEFLQYKANPRSLEEVDVCLMLRYQQEELRKMKKQ